MTRAPSCHLWLTLACGVSAFLAVGCAETSTAPPTAGHSPDPRHAPLHIPEEAPAPTPQPTVTVTTLPLRADSSTQDDDIVEGHLPPPAVERRVVEGTGGAWLTHVRVGRHRGYDRLVLEFAGGLPAVTAEYVAAPISNTAAGAELELPGSAVLHLHLTRLQVAQSSTQLERSARLTGSGAPIGGPVLGYYVDTGAGTERHLYLGVDGQRKFRTFLLQDPLRIVVDVFD
ncbi:AMIN-like domain-containing (lipo)protein [Buchananella hordeovulneris]|uniref:AMIN-like domain-containing protein n=1 Tax=Buchananella hordeovulneris TaxID=52770 RepID=A0A1Q5PWX1_9ACTO|nr:hypothetical protein [Buchananella hordeovulneris]MDO5081254.1 hypothetical protein [Buchananella hordeovulneris]OKL52057.1 hypothetical protein BSZ40_03840 [Buchananella hordeovulneris]RRD45010.1 hypothetical protein EII13_02305 [Buchananella hordeovulneris]RRD51852.1 hypothetical protein EII12_07105 [Buchananella hordeovulneris]